MKDFQFTRNKEAISKLIADASKFIKILSFQFSDESFIRNRILPRAKEIDIEIITLPEDSYKNSLDRTRIKILYDDLIAAGVQLHKCKWEVGDPTLSNSSQSGEANEGGGSKWYSLHGKLLFSEHQGLVLTSNFTDNEELESYLFCDESGFVQNLNDKFNQIKKMFIGEGEKTAQIYLGLDKQIRESVDETYNSSNRLVIPHYPTSLISNSLMKEGLAITPFDGKARDYLYRFIDESKDYLYLSSERFFDEETVTRLISHKKNKSTLIKILTGPSGQIRDNNSKAEKMLFDLLTSDIQINFIDDIHAKSWISDTGLAIGSVNLGQMNLGIKKTNRYWRSNTEMLYITADLDLIKRAKCEFEDQFYNGKEPIKYISKSSRSKNSAKVLFSGYSVSSRDQAKELVGLISTTNRIQGQKSVIKIVELSVLMKTYFCHRYVEKEDVLFALIRYQLSESKLNESQLFDKVKYAIDSINEYKSITRKMISCGLIENEDSYYKNSLRLLTK